MPTHRRLPIDRRPSSIPVIHRSVRWVWLALPVLVLAGVGLTMASPWVGLAVIFAVVMGSVHGVNFVLGRWERRVREARGCLCPACGYPFPPASRRCSECGIEIEAAAVRARWRHALSLEDFVEEGDGARRGEAT